MDRDFKGVWIPCEIWLDERLSALEKMIYAEIDSLDINNEGCFAKNDYLAEFCQCTVRTISNAITHLKDLSYIEVVGFDGRGRRIRTTLQKFPGSIEKFSTQHRKNFQADSQNFPGRPPDTLYENTIRETYKSNKGFRPPTLDEVRAYCEERKNDIDPEAFIDHYTANGWVQGKGKPIRDWRAAVRQWERNEFSSGRKPKQQQMTNSSFETSDLEALFASDLENIVKDGEKNGV